MSEYVLKNRAVPLDESWDVIVVGGGPAGCTAAASAARAGAKTLLVEAAGALGGMGTSGLVPAWCPFTDKERIIYGGLAERVLKACMAGMPHVPEDRFDWTPIDAELLKRLYDDLLADHGATVLFNSCLAAVEKEQTESVDAIVVANKSGLTAYRAKVYVDATGDADLAAWAGAAYEKGDGSGDLQPATHCFTLTNVDMYAYRHCGRIKTKSRSPRGSVIDRIIASGKYPEIPDRHACNNIVGPGAVGFNAGHVWSVDNTDPFSVSRGLVQGRKIAKAFRDACAEFFPAAFANAHLTQTAPLLGIRETRRIMGAYRLTIDDFTSLRSFPDEICRNCYFIDVHHRQVEIGSDQEGASHAIHLQKGQSHGIPYRCLTPRGLKNVLVAGRSISTDRTLQGSTRVMPVCLCMGEAAGLAAAMAAGAGRPDIHTVDTQALRNQLRAQGAYLPEVEGEHRENGCSNDHSS
ncbi:MAG: FAD-dependent oxidoreductase [Kiritimatiellia bacterium]|nr:FAD-dependent oxidoreductase [Lentisphaerota bacterium]